jgi:hypothetical protein
MRTSLSPTNSPPPKHRACMDADNSASLLTVAPGPGHGYAKCNIPVNFTAALALNFYEDGLALPVSDTQLSIVFKTDNPKASRLPAVARSPDTEGTS